MPGSCTKDKAADTTTVTTIKIELGSEDGISMLAYTFKKCKYWSRLVQENWTYRWISIQICDIWKFKGEYDVSGLATISMHLVSLHVAIRILHYPKRSLLLL